MKKNMKKTSDKPTGDKPPRDPLALLRTAARGHLIDTWRSGRRKAVGEVPADEKECCKAVGAYVNEKLSEGNTETAVQAIHRLLTGAMTEYFNSGEDKVRTACYPIWGFRARIAQYVKAARRSSNGRRARIVNHWDSEEEDCPMDRTSPRSGGWDNHV
jgi:hypothetical protein